MKKDKEFRILVYIMIIIICGYVSVIVFDENDRVKSTSINMID